MNFAANDPCPPVPPLRRPAVHRDLLLTILSAANDNEPQTTIESVALLRLLANQAAAWHRPG